MTRSLLIFLLFLSTGLYAQQTEFSNYDWNTFPYRAGTDTVKSVNGSLITLERRINDVYLNKEDIFEELVIYHRKIRVESHDAINRYNKIYVPVNNVIEVLGIKARFISPAGRITDVPQESIRKIENLENKGNFQTFAIEGAEAGGEIEYYYKLRKKFNAYGTIVMQGNDPRINVEIIYAYPSKLEFYIKSYNGFPDFTASGDTAKDRSYLKAFVPYIAAIPNEKYSAYDADMMRYEFTLSHNNYTSALRTYSFSKLSSTMYNNIYITTKSEKSAVKDYLKKQQITGKSFTDQIRVIENRLKTEIVITEELASTPSIEDMLKFRQTTKYGMTRLMVACLNGIGADFDLVISCKQTERRFDPDFNGWNFLDDYLIFLPGLNSVIVPEDASSRSGLIPSEYQASYGLFLHPVSYENNLNTLAYDIKQLPADNYKLNTDSLFIKLKVNLDKMNLDADIHRAFSGELASGFQSFWNVINAERQAEIVKEMFNMGNQNTTIRSYELFNYLPDDIAIHSLLWNVNLTANSLIEQAGDDILIKIGETIGEQSELYQQSTRKLPVYVGSLHSYYRKIEFEIPEGYTISNLENLNMKVEKLFNGKVSCSFTADYELSGNLLTIHSTEFYSELEYPVGDFESFRDVINAAADFNKKTILLTKN